MAKKEIIRYLDDLDLRKKGVETDGAVNIVFSYDGHYYSIDLAKKNKDAFENALAPYMDAAELLSGSVARSLAALPGRKPATVDPEQRKVMRRWWHDFWKPAGLRRPQVKGSIPKEVVDAYHKYHGMDPRKMKSD